MGRRSKYTDEQWASALRAYIESDAITLREVSQAAGIPYRTCEARASRDNWTAQRRQRQQNEAQAAIEARRDEARLGADAQVSARLKFLRGAMRELDRVDNELEALADTPDALTKQRLVNSRKMLQDQVWRSFGLPMVTDVESSVRPATVVYLPQPSGPEPGDYPQTGGERDPGDGQGPADDEDQ